VQCTALAGRHSADDVSAILNHLFRMECAFFAGDALDYEARGFVYENAQRLLLIKDEF
jgi:hypothetical protein